MKDPTKCKCHCHGKWFQQVCFAPLSDAKGCLCITKSCQHCQIEGVEDCLCCCHHACEGQECGSFTGESRCAHCKESPNKGWKPYNVDPNNWKEILAGKILNWDRAEPNNQEKAYDAIPEYVESLLKKAVREERDRILTRCKTEHDKYCDTPVDWFKCAEAKTLNPNRR